jgi:hypothetical protein
MNHSPFCTYPDGCSCGASHESELSDLRTRLQTAEQKLGQVEGWMQDALNLIGTSKCPDCTGLGYTIKPNRETGEPEQDQCFWCAMRDVFLKEHSAATPSDGCGKGRTDKERLDWLEKQEDFQLVDATLPPPYEGATWEMGFEIKREGEVVSSGNRVREAIDKAMEAASSKGKEGGE